MAEPEKNANNKIKAWPGKSEPIAIIGMRGRFPGANDLDQYWQNLASGTESITVLTHDEMRAAGVPEAIFRLPGYVNASPVLDGIDQFDAQFFGFSARDASLTDPQHRLFLETAWESLEDAGYDPDRFPGAIGVFGGCELSTYLYHLSQNLDSLKYIDGMQLMVTNDKDHLCTQVSYRLNLRGPSIVVQTTCSTSLVAISLACESLHHGRCDIALAGGVTVRVPQRGGYFYAAGSILSPDGHCRPFDANAQGTIVGSGVGLVVLKRLSHAIADKDNIRALILGTGINNDGNDKVGYTAPSTRGQSIAIQAAHSMSGVPASSIGYVEAHGTGTILGDPIEFSALNQVFQSNTKKRGFCGIGSVKSNFGHLSCAAGVAGLIKTVLSLENASIPPTVHFTAPNPAIDLTKSPFYVTTRLTHWERNGTPRRAGVSSFGVGGTNAHIIVEEAPERIAEEKCRPFQLLTLSARSEAALDDVTSRLAKHLEKHPGLDLADVAHTLHVGRRIFRHRRTIVAESAGTVHAAARLAQFDKLPASLAVVDRPVVMLFPGQGSQYPGMAAGLYQTEPIVRRSIQQCLRVLKPLLDIDLKQVLFPSAARKKDAAETLKDTKFAQPTIFTVSYALAQLWMSWGISPAAMMGHSVGEYVAAVLSGVMTLDDALRIIARRGQLISGLPRGSMLAVMGEPEQVQHLLDDDVSIAAINAPGFVVLSGPTAAMEKAAADLTDKSVATRKLHTSHAFHSSMMDPILTEFEELVASIPLHKPTKPFMTTLNGSWAGDDVTQPLYWVKQLRETVRFADGLKALAEPGSPAGNNPVYLECGPGNALTTFSSEFNRKTEGSALSINSLPGADGSRADTEEVLNTLGFLWSKGVTVDWQGFHRTEPRGRVSLPTYPFERQSFWVGKRPESSGVMTDIRDTSKWFYEPVWQNSPLGTTPVVTGGRVLLFDEPTSISQALIEKLRSHGWNVVTVKRGDRYGRISDEEYTLDPADAAGIKALVSSVCSGTEKLSTVIDCWGAMSPDVALGLDSAATVSLMMPARMAFALTSQPTTHPLSVVYVTRSAQQVLPGDPLDPNRALIIGVARVLPQEHPMMRVTHIDIDHHDLAADNVLQELEAGLPETTIGLRQGQRYVENYLPLQVNLLKTPELLPPSPVVLITGGLGHMGLHLAEALYQRMQVKLVLVGRANLPPAEEWAAKSADANTPAEQQVMLKRLATMRAKRDEVIVLKADLNKADEVKAAVDAAIARFGSVDLVVHGAARIDAAAFATVGETTPEVIEAQFSPKLRGLYYLIDAFRDREPARWVLHSSISLVLGGLALMSYSSANAVLDTLAQQRGNNWLSIDWDAWDNAAEAQSASLPLSINPPEGADAFLRLLRMPLRSRVLVAVNLMERLQAWVQRSSPAQHDSNGERHPRPSLSTAYVPPRNDTERDLTEIWGAQLGLESVGIHDRFFDLGGHSLLAAQIASEICDHFNIELSVLKLFQAPTIAELAIEVENARSANASRSTSESTEGEAVPEASELRGDDAGIAAKSSYRSFYNDISRRLEYSGVGGASFFLNYGYVPMGNGDEARYDVPAQIFNRNSVRLGYELISSTNLEDRRVLDVGCGRGGNVAMMTEVFKAKATGVDLAPEAVAFCRKTHHVAEGFEVGDAENLPFPDSSFEVVTNVESSHTYPSLRAFYGEVRRVLESGGRFLYTDLLPVERWAEVRAILSPLGFQIEQERDITPNVLASCDEIAGQRAQAFGGQDAMIENFLAVPGSAVYEQMNSGAWEYRILRSRLKK